MSKKILFIAVEINEGEDLSGVGGTGVDVVEAGGLGSAEEGGLEVLDRVGMAKGEEKEE